MKRKALGAGAAVAAMASAAVGLSAATAAVERRRNRLHRAPPYVASAYAQELLRTIDVVDLHADTLLWGRDLLARANRGHLDVPRMIEGGIALQGLAICTKVPRGINIERNDDRTDNVTFLAIAQRWPVDTWRSLLARALHHASRAHAFAARSGGAFTVITSRAALSAYLVRRPIERNVAAAFLAVEGAHALEGDPANVDRLADAGIVMLSPTHFFDNEFAGSAHGVTKGGLTPLGRDMVRRMEARSMVVDLAHASVHTIDDVLAMATRPVVVSHTGVNRTCPSVRNLSDDHLRRVAERGGLIGIGFWPTAVCGDDAAAIGRAVSHAVSVAGVYHVGLGSDFDGAVPVPFDATGIPLLVDALLAEGFADAEVRQLMGGNALRLLANSLPER